jgi:hypothetical protein
MVWEMTFEYSGKSYVGVLGGSFPYLTKPCWESDLKYCNIKESPVHLSHDTSRNAMMTSNFHRPS